MEVRGTLYILKDIREYQYGVRAKKDDGDGLFGEHHGDRGFDHLPDYHSDDAFCEEEGRHL